MGIRVLHYGFTNEASCAAAAAIMANEMVTAAIYVKKPLRLLISINIIKNLKLSIVINENISIYFHNNLIYSES